MTTARDRDTEVLIVGAGPSGLVLALWLKHFGVDVRIVDKNAEAGTTSRALVVHARTLELYRQVDVADEIVANGLALTAVNLWVRGERAGRAAFGDLGRGLSPFPFVLIFAQDEHEKLLIRRLRRAGVEVERRTELVGFEDRGDHVLARMKRADGTETECRALYLAGCDGAHSAVREGLGVEFPGGTYEHLFYVADVELHGQVANGELHVALDEADFAAVFPLKGDGTARLIGTVRPDARAQRDITWDDVSRHALSRMEVAVDRINWFSTYHVHHRVAEHFARGRAFLVGDAGHIHSPVGGQGMNTGIGDAVNLAWKLAAVLRRGASTALCDTYEPERIEFARRLVATTDRAFTLATRNGAIARRVRIDAIPRLVPPFLESEAVRRFIFRTISQTLVNYRGSRLSEGHAGSVRGGDRLPWVAPASPAGDDNFAPLSSVDWQLHVYGRAPANLVNACTRRGIALHVFPWRSAMAHSGLARNASYLVRPDGYVALADARARPATLERYLDGIGIRSR